MDAVVLYPQVGTKDDTASATGSLHAKVKDIKDAVGSSSDVRTNNTIMGWLASPIKSIQRGTIAINGSGSANATISSVNTSKAFVNFLGYKCTTDSLIDGATNLVLTNATTVTATRGSATGVVTVSYEVIEFY